MKGIPRFSGWMRAAALLALAIAAIGSVEAPKTVYFLDNFMWMGGFHLAILGVVSILRTPAAIVAGIAAALLSILVANLSVLHPPTRDSGLAYSLVVAMTLPGAGIGALIAATALRRSALTSRPWKAASTALVAVIVCAAVQVVLMKFL